VFAIVLAGWSSKLRLLGLSTVAGNQTLEKVTRNALDVLYIAGLVGLGEPAVAGFSPMRVLGHKTSCAIGPRSQVARLPPARCRGAPWASQAPDQAVSHTLPGDSRRQWPRWASGGAAPARLLPAAVPNQGRRRHAAGDQPRLARPAGHQGAATASEVAAPTPRSRLPPASTHSDPAAPLPPRRLVCTGALTNAALLLTLFPEVQPMVEVVLMGGAMGAGNTGACAARPGRWRVRRPVPSTRGEPWRAVQQPVAAAGWQRRRTARPGGACCRPTARRCRQG
jgi:hypothetical protein